MASALRRFIAPLNLFHSYSTNPAIIHQEIITTRIYLGLLLLTFSILFAYSSQREFQHTIQLDNPSIEDYRHLNSIHYSTLSCPCSKLAVPYKSFLTLEPIFHPVCTSDFVSDQWLLYVYREIPSIYDPIELRAVGYAYFQLLLTICHSSKQVIDLALKTKLTTQTLISSNGQVLASESVHIQANAFIDDFIASIASKQQSLYSLLLAVIEGNHVWSALGTNAMAQYSEIGQIIVLSRHYDIWTDTFSTRGICRCEADYTCNTKLFVYNNTQDLVENPLRIPIGQRRSTPLPGFRAGCTPLRSLLQSSIECFVNISCLNMILTSRPRSDFNFNTFIIDASNNSLTKTIIDILASNLMIIDWITKIYYPKYFETCRPLVCSYSYAERFNIFYIVTTIVGLLGGLTVTCRFLAPLITKLYFKINTPNRQERPEVRQSLKQNFNKIYRRGREFLITLNLYKKRNDTHFIIRQKILATRLYISLLICIIFLLFLITVSDQRTKTITLNTPSVLEFENLLNANAVAVSCPCSKIAISYSTFINLVPTLHQICHSDFLSDDWMDRLVFSTNGNVIPYYHLDIRSYGLTTFRTLRNLCIVVNVTLIDALKNFQAAQLISIQALSREQLKREINTIITEFQSTIAVTFSQTFQMAHMIIHGNQLLTVTLSNVFVQPKFDESGHPSSLQLHLGILLNANDTALSCSCLLDTCAQQLAFYNISDLSAVPTPLFAIPGMQSACYPLDGFRLSTLECWFNETCITLLRIHLEPISVEQTIPVLDSTKQRRFPLSATLGDIIDELMIEEWTNTTNYEAYFSNCRPLTCNYLVFHRLDLLYTVTTLIGVFGGLCVILRKMCPLLIRCYFRFCVRSHSQRVSSSTGPDLIAKRTNNNYSIPVRLRNFIIKINVFDSDSPHTNVQERERLATRIYITFLILMSVILFIYLLLTENAQRITVVRPSLSTVVQLQEKHGLSLSCPCSQPSTAHSTFFTATVDRYHAICASDFITRTYRETLMSDNSTVVPSSTLFVRQFLAAQLTLLSNLCTIANETINASLALLYRKPLITLQMMNTKEFEDTINVTIDQFYADTIVTFRNTFDFLQTIIQQNEFMSSFLSNWYFQLDFSPASTYNMFPTFYGNCSCGKMSTAHKL